jgi:hypothetical protein
MVLCVIFWILLILSFIGYFAPDTYAKHFRLVELILFTILGLKIFGVAGLT